MKILLLMLLISFSVFAQNSKLKIVTINVWSGLDYNGSLKMAQYESPTRKNERFLILLSQLKELSPDIIFLQETNSVGEYSARLADIILTLGKSFN